MKTVRASSCRPRASARPVALPRGGGRLLLWPVACGLLLTATQAQESPADLELFEKKIRPLLAERCFSCHSATAEKLKGGLLLDSRDGLLRGGDTGPA